MLNDSQTEKFRLTGHLTVTDLFDSRDVQAALDDVDRWSQEFLSSLPVEKQSWYLERAAKGEPALRKLDNPVFHRAAFRQLATSPALVEIVEQLIGPEPQVFFSQVFMKPPGVGGPKPIHQDNFYFGPDDLDATLTVWIALDEATTENGCLYYCDQHQTSVVEHEAPNDEPFNLQIPIDVAEQFVMNPAPVPRGGVSFHHGNTPHQSSSNRSQRPRRAAAIHYLRSGAGLIHPALPYDDRLFVKVNG